MNRIEEVLNMLSTVEDNGKHEHISIAKGRHEIPRTMKDVIRASRRYKDKIKAKRNG